MDLSELTLETVLSRLTEWRNFPKYQLERHVDVLMSFFLTDVFQRKFNRKISSTIIPELPIRYDGEYNRSWNVDFALFSTDLEIAYLVELKTDEASVNQKQDDRLASLLRRQDVGERVFDAVILEGIKSIAQATNHRWKYRCLLKALEEAGVIEDLPPQLRDAKSSAQLRGLNRDITAGVKLKQHPKVQVVYIVPNDRAAQSLPQGVAKITFSEFLTLCRPTGESPLRTQLELWKSPPGGQPTASGPPPPR